MVLLDIVQGEQECCEKINLIIEGQERSGAVDHHFATRNRWRSGIRFG